MTLERISNLVVQTSYLGDVVLTTPLIALLARSGPVDVVTTPAAANRLGHVGYWTAAVVVVLIGASWYEVSQRWAAGMEEAYRAHPEDLGVGDHLNLADAKFIK